MLLIFATKGDASDMDTGFPTPRNNRSTFAMNAEPERDTSLLRWWYRLTAPAPVPASASLQQREIARRGRITSATLLVVILLVLAVEPVAIFGSNKSLIVVLLVPIILYIIALAFNKHGKIATAGILTIIGMELGIILATLGPALSGEGFTTYTLPQYDMLVQAEFVAVTLLPPYTVFLMVLLHSAFIALTVLYLPRSAEYAAVLAAGTNEYGIFLRPLTLQIIVAVVTYLWVTSAYQALRRADRAEVIAELEHRETERQQQELVLKQQLDEGIQQILNTHVQVANGDFSARTPLKQENVLWRIAYSLNNLLARLQSSNAAETELQRARRETARLTEAIHRAKQGHPMKLSRTGTHLDPLIMELMTGPSMSGPTPNNAPGLEQDSLPPQMKGKRDTRDFRL
jgi:hypothetical protein